MQAFGQVWRALKRNKTGVCGSVFRPDQKTFAGDEKIFPFTGQNRRTAIRVESQRVAKTDNERRKVEDGGTSKLVRLLLLTIRIFVFQFSYFLAKDSFLVNDVEIIWAD